MLSLEAEYGLYVMTTSPQRAHLSSVRTLISCLKKKKKLKSGQDYLITRQYRKAHAPFDFGKDVVINSNVHHGSARPGPEL